MGNALLFISLALVYAVLKIVLERRLAPLDVLGDESSLADLAFSRGCSVYELFKEAGNVWNFSAAKIEEDFKRFLKDGAIPGYVSDFSRSEVPVSDRTYQKLLFSGGRPPYL